MEPTEINPSDFIYSVPITASDAQLIQVRDNGVVDLLSLQFRSFNTKQPKVEVVAAIRLQGGVEGLRNLKKAIDDNLEQLDKRED